MLWTPSLAANDPILSSQTRDFLSLLTLISTPAGHEAVVGGKLDRVSVGQANHAHVFSQVKVGVGVKQSHVILGTVSIEAGMDGDVSDTFVLMSQELVGVLQVPVSTSDTER